MTFIDINAPLTGVSRSSIATGDFDKDGDLDLLIAGLDQSTDITHADIYLNDGSGGFTEDTSANLTGVKWGSVATEDVDGDNDLDLLITGLNAPGNIETAEIYLNDGSGGFTEDTAANLPGVSGSTVVMEDFNGDGSPDIFLSGRTVWNAGSAITKIYINDGSGGFTEDTSSNFVAGNLATSASAEDFNDDGDLDLLVTEADNGENFTTKIYTNDGSGSFTEDTAASAILTDVGSEYNTIEDFDGDGDPDLLIYGQDNSGNRIAKIYLNDGSGGFTEDTSANLTGVSGSSAATEDFDGDGDLDLLVSGIDASNNYITRIYLNDGSGGFTEDTSANINGAIGAVATGDFNADGKHDLVISGVDTNGNDLTEVYLNDYTPSNAGRDIFDGIAGNETLDGGLSDDTLKGSLGADFLIGGEGMDRADYRQSAAAVTVDLLANTATGGDADGDTFDSIEDIDGSRLGDALTGDNNDNRIYGGNGDDTIVGNDGNDILRGQNGADSLDGGAGLDNLAGGNGNDTLVGGAGNDFVYGGAGADSITGADTTTNGVGEIDRLSDGAGSDVFVLGTTGTAYYDDGVNTTNGISDYALIYNFNPTEGDAIELPSSQTYYLGANPLRTLSGTGIFIDNDGTAGLSDNDELVGLLEGSTLASGQITGSTTGFSLV